jgi:hypothetical protein
MKTLMHPVKSMTLAGALLLASLAPAFAADVRTYTGGRFAFACVFNLIGGGCAATSEVAPRDAASGLPTGKRQH